jgi:hypothetical protein
MRDLSNANVRIGEQRPRGFKIVLREFRRTPSGASRTPSGGEARLGPLPDQAALEFCQRAKHVKNQPSLRGRRVEGFGQAAKRDAAYPQVFDGFDQLLHRPRQSVELPYNQRVAGLGKRSPPICSPSLPILHSELESKIYPHSPETGVFAATDRAARNLIGN